MGRKPNPEHKRKDARTAIRISKSLKDQIMALSNMSGRTYNDIAIMAMEFGIEGVKAMTSAELKAKHKWQKNKVVWSSKAGVMIGR